MSRVIRGLAVTTVALLILAAPLRAQTAASGADDDRWHFVVAPYFFAAGLSGTASFRGLPELPVDVPASTVLENLDIGFANRFEGRKGRFGFATDLLYMNLGANVSSGEVLGRVEPEVDFRQLVMEGDAFYRAYQSGKGEGAPGFVDLLVGARYNGMSAQLRGAELEGTKNTFEWVDGVAGVRFQAPLGRKLALAGRGDVAGLGSDFTFQLQGDVAFHPSPRWALSLGYRYYDVDYDKGALRDRKVYKIASKGPVMAVAYGW